MGVTKTQSRLINPAAAAIPGISLSAKPSEITDIHIDANSVLYKATELVCGYGQNANVSQYLRAKQMAEVEVEDDFTELDIAIMKQGVDILVAIITDLKPKLFAGIYVDGRVPSSKNHQGAKRRYMTKRKVALITEGEGEVTPETEAKLLFDTTKFTAGTKFMEAFDKRILDTLATVPIRNMEAEIYYSSYREAGEGEHKIIAMLKSDIIPQSGSHVVVSADSDMVILAATLPLANLYVFRETLNRWVGASQLSYYLTRSWGPNANLDAVLILPLLGNDFLPPQPSFFPGPDGIVLPNSKNPDESGNSLFQIYARQQASLVTIEDDVMTIDWSTLRVILQDLAATEYDRLGRIYNFMDNQDPRWNDALFRNKPADGYEKFRAAWYDMAFPSMTGEEKANAIRGMVKEYLKGLAWVTGYYLLGYDQIDPNYVYPYHYAPLLTDIVSLTWGDTQFEDEVVLGDVPYEEALATLPEQLTLVMPAVELDQATESYDFLHAIMPTYFPLPALDSVRVDTLGFEVTDDPELYALDLPILSTSKLRDLLTVQQIVQMSPVNEETGEKEVDEESAESTLELYEASKDDSQYTARGAVVLERRSAPQGGGNVRNRPARMTKEEVSERVARAAPSAEGRETLTLAVSELSIAPPAAAKKAPSGAAKKAPAPATKKAPAPATKKAPAPPAAKKAPSAPAKKAPPAPPRKS